jgi:hypothetical protein
MFEVVDNEKQVAIPHRGGQLLHQRNIPALQNEESLGDTRQHGFWLSQRCQRDEPDAVGKDVGDHCCGFDGQARLSHAAGSGQRHKADVLPKQQAGDLLDLSFSPDQRGQRAGNRSGGGKLYGISRHGIHRAGVEQGEETRYALTTLRWKEENGKRRRCQVVYETPTRPAGSPAPSRRSC